MKYHLESPFTWRFLKAHPTATSCLLLFAVLTCSCSSLVFHEKPRCRQKVCLSALGETTIEFDSARYSGITLSITNDLVSDVFIKDIAYPYDAEFLTEPVNTEQPFRLPDLDETVRQYRESIRGRGRQPFVTFVAEKFTFVWSGHTGCALIYNTDGAPAQWYVPITYYQCNDKSFYTRSLKLVEMSSGPGKPN